MNLIDTLASIYYERLPKRFVRCTRSILEPGYEFVMRVLGIARDLFPTISLVDTNGRDDKRTPSFIVAGRGDVRGFFFQRLYGNEPPGEAFGRKLIWKVRTADTERTTATLIEADRCFGRLLARQGFVAIPEWVLFTLDLSAPWDEIERGWRSHNRENFRRINKFEYSHKTTSDLEQLRFFYDRMFQPYISTRHGESAANVSFGYMQNLLERGVLLILHCGGEAVAGFLIWTAPAERPMVAFMGIRDADPLLLKRGTATALYYHCALWAREQGYQSLDFGHTRPFLRDGLLLWKKRWDMQIQRSNRKYRSLYLLLKNRNAEFERFLAENPLVCEERGQLRALVYLPGQIQSVGPEELPRENDWYVDGLQGMRTLQFDAAR